MVGLHVVYYKIIYFAITDDTVNLFHELFKESNIHRIY